MDGPRLRTLQRALALVGTKERLAIALDTSVPDIERYLNGEPLPHELFIAALDIVAGNQSRKSRERQSWTSTTPTHRRRVRSRSSLSLASAAAAPIGTSAIPQSGQLPGASRTICGCIGQVYFPPDFAGSGYWATGARARDPARRAHRVAAVRARREQPRRIGAGALSVLLHLDRARYPLALLGDMRHSDRAAAQRR